MKNGFGSANRKLDFLDPMNKSIRLIERSPGPAEYKIEQKNEEKSVFLGTEKKPEIFPENKNPAPN